MIVSQSFFQFNSPQYLYQPELAHHGSHHYQGGEGLNDVELKPENQN